MKTRQITVYTRIEVDWAISFTDNGQKPPIRSSTIFTQSNWNLVCTLICRVFRSDSMLSHGPISACWWPQNDRKLWFLIIICKINGPIHFNLGVYTWWVRVQNWIAFWVTLVQFQPKMTEKCWFRTIIGTNIYSMKLKLGVYTYLPSE